MGIRDFLSKQFIDVIQWTEPEEGILSYRYPMQDMEIQNGGKLTVRESQAALFVNEGRAADAFGPGLYTLNTQNLPILTNLMNWDKKFESPFKSDVYFFSVHQNINQKWGTQNPLTIRDKEFGAIRVRGNGVYSWHIVNPKQFHQKVAGTRAEVHVADVEEQLRSTVIGQMGDAIGQSGIPFLDLISNQVELGAKILAGLQPAFDEFGLQLDTFVVREFSLPEELQKKLDERISMNMLGDMGRYTQYQVAQSIPIAAANEGSGAVGTGMGLGAGLLFGQQFAGALGGGMNPQQAPPPQGGAPGGGMAAAPGVGPVVPVAPTAPAAAPTGETKFCSNCGNKIPRAAKFCTECGSKQE